MQTLAQQTSSAPSELLQPSQPQPLPALLPLGKPGQTGRALQNSQSTLTGDMLTQVMLPQLLLRGQSSGTSLQILQLSFAQPNPHPPQKRDHVGVFWNTLPDLGCVCGKGGWSICGKAPDSLHALPPTAAQLE